MITGGIILAFMIGIISIILGFIALSFSVFKPYALSGTAVGIFVLVTAAWFAGGRVNENEHQMDLLQLQVKLSAIEKQAAEVNTKMEYALLDKIRVVKETQVVTQEKIRDISVVIDDQCKISSQVVDILNEAARTPN